MRNLKKLFTLFLTMIFLVSIIPTSVLMAVADEGPVIYVIMDHTTDADADGFVDYDDAAATVTASVYLKGAMTLQAFDFYVANSTKLIYTGFSSTVGAVRVTEGEKASDGALQHIQMIGTDVGTPTDIVIPDDDVGVRLATLTYTFADSAAYNEQLSVALVTTVGMEPNIGVADAAAAYYPTIDDTFAGAEIKQTYAVTYHANAGMDAVTNLPGPQAKSYKEALDLDSALPVREDYHFLGYATSADGDVVYQPGDTLPAALNEPVDLYAKWSLILYTVTFQSQDGETQLDQTVDVAPGTALTYNGEVPTKERTDKYTFSFAGWATETDAESGLPLSEYPMPKRDLTLYAAFSKTVNQYEVKWYNQTGDAVLETDSTEYDAVPTFDGTTPTKDADSTYTYTFSGWASEPNQETGLAELPTVDGVEAYYAAFSKAYIDYTLTYGAGAHPNAEYTVPSPVTAHYGDKVTLPAAAIPAAGYTFAGWSDGVTTYDVGDEYTVSGTATLTALYTENRYTVVYNANQGVGTLPEGGNYLYTETFTVGSGENLSRTGYTFSGWNTAANNSGTALSANVEVSGLSAVDGDTVTLYARWTAKTYIITYNYNGGALADGETNVTSYNINEMNAQRLINHLPIKTGYSFNGWEATYTESGEPLTLVENHSIPANTVGNLTVTALWTPAEVNYTVEHYQQNLDNDNYTIVSADTQTLTGYSEADTEAEANEYEGFTAQSFDQAEILPNGSTVVKIYYNRNFYEVSYAYVSELRPEGEPELPASAVYKYGATVNVAVAPSLTGYVFDGWSTADATIANGSFQMPAQDVSISGGWQPDVVHYTVRYLRQNVNDNEYTEVEHSAQDLTGYTGAQTEAEANEYTGFTALPITQATIAPDGSTVVNVYYDRNSYAVSYAYDDGAPEAAPDLPATVEYRFGANVTVANVPSLNSYTFTGWMVPEGVTVIDGSFVMPAMAVELRGVWSEIEYTVTFVTNGAPITPITYTVTSEDVLPTSTGYGLCTFRDWLVTTQDGNWTENAAVNAGTALTGKYGNVTLTAEWDFDLTWNVEEYKYGYRSDTARQYLLRVGEGALTETQTYTFDGAALYFTEDANYKLGDENAFYTLVSGEYVASDAETGVLSLNATGLALLATSAVENRVTIAYTGDVNGDGCVLIADANDVFQMLANATAGGYYSLGQVDLLGRLTADMDKATTDTEHRGSIADVHAIVDIINRVSE